MKHYMKQMLLTPMDRSMPIYIETLGWNETQSEFVRPDGYHCYHWLQTTGGEGKFELSGKLFTLLPNQGILLKPNTPHRYATLSHPWSTWYLTFNGSLATSIVSSLGLTESAVISWDSSSPLSTIYRKSRKLANQNVDLTGMDGSAFLYRFLIDLKRYVQKDNQRSLSQYSTRLMPLMRLLEDNYANPGLGLVQMAEHAGVSPQHLNHLFRMTTGMSPYQYLIHIRIQKAKEFLINEESLTVKAIACRVGFLDASHFVSTFRKLETITPEKFRNLN